MRGKAQADRDGKQRLLNRRDYLAAAGVAGLTAMVGVGSASAQTGEYEEGLLVDASASDAACTYTVECDGDVTRVRTMASVSDTIDGGLIEGRVDDGVAAYKLTGSVTSFAVDGTATVEYGQEALSKVPDPSHTIEIEAPGDLTYEFTTTGEASKLFDNGTMAAELSNDEIISHDDGSCTVRGYTGNGYGDSYTFRGEVAEFAPFEGEFTIRVDGTEVSVSELTGQAAPTNEVMISTPDAVDYEFTTSGEASKLLDRGPLSAEVTNDAITGNDDGTCTITGFTGNPGYGDSYEFEGEITDFSPLRMDVSVQVNGTTMTSYELMGVDPTADDTSDTSSGSTSATIGGGDGYQDTISPSEATVTVSTRSALASALSSVSRGDIVYVDGNAEINMGTSELTIPAGVTLASDRGIDGSAGAHLRTDDRPWGMLTARDDVRITGIRVGGPRWEWIGNVGGEMGIDVAGSNVEIDNCEVYGWGYASVRTSDDTHVHHCEIHHNSKDGTGYGVSTGSSANPIIEYNEFYHNRHSVASSENGYTARYNYVGKGAISHVFDQHSPGGSTITIHHNTVEVVEHATKDKNAPAVAIRGVPDGVADIHHNWFYNPKAPRDTPSGWTDEAIIQVHVDSWQHVDFHNNHYGSDDPGTDIGHPR